MHANIRFAYTRIILPVQGMDYRAHLAGNEESGPFGWGMTKEEAYIDLLEQTIDN